MLGEGLVQSLIPAHNGNGTTCTIIILLAERLMMKICFDHQLLESILIMRLKSSLPINYWLYNLLLDLINSIKYLKLKDSTFLLATDSYECRKGRNFVVENCIKLPRDEPLSVKAKGRGTSSFREFVYKNFGVELMRLRNFLYKVWCRADNFLVYKETGCR
jgi:hypothetical protein